MLFLVFKNKLYGIQKLFYYNMEVWFLFNSIEYYFLMNFLIFKYSIVNFNGSSQFQQFYW